MHWKCAITRATIDDTAAPSCRHCSSTHSPWSPGTCCNNLTCSIGNTRTNDSYNSSYRYRLLFFSIFSWHRHCCWWWWSAMRRAMRMGHRRFSIRIPVSIQLKFMLYLWISGSAANRDLRECSQCIDFSRLCTSRAASRWIDLSAAYYGTAHLRGLVYLCLGRPGDTVEDSVGIQVICIVCIGVRPKSRVYYVILGSVPNGTRGG